MNGHVNIGAYHTTTIDNLERNHEQLNRIFAGGGFINPSQNCRT